MVSALRRKIIADKSYTPAGQRQVPIRQHFIGVHCLGSHHDGLEPSLTTRRRILVQQCRERRD